MTRSIAKPLPEPENNVYPPCLTLRFYRQKHRLSTSLLAILTAIERADGQDFIKLVQDNKFRAPIDQAWISNAENGAKFVNPRNRRLLAAVVSKFEKRQVSEDELFPEYRDQPGLAPVAIEVAPKRAGDRAIKVLVSRELYEQLHSACNRLNADRDELIRSLICVWLEKVETIEWQLKSKEAPLALRLGRRSG
jgi:hypothetical protein